ncbi:hypothetical protein D3C71_1402630 [compost metagenome]
MDQAVLVHADIHEGTERGHIADHAFQNHAFPQILDVFHTLSKTRRLEFRARIAAGLFQLLEDVAHGRYAEFVVGELFGFQAAQITAVAQQRPDRAICCRNNALDHRIRFRMHRRRIQRLITVTDTQEARALLEGLVAQARHFEQILAAFERAILIAVTHDVFSHRR